jgi:ABC-2 type transport system ATP-binding protein
MRTIEYAMPAEHAVAVEGLTRRFGARTAIADLSLSVGAGEVAGLIGANGGGKTTSLRMLAGLLKPDAGSGRVLGHDLALDDRRIRGDVGYMAQRLAVYPSLSVLDNLRFRADVYGVPNARATVRAAIADYGLTPYANLPAERLSGGWARLLQLAAALLHAPRLVLLDEPTAGLDAAARQAVWQRIASLAGAGAAVVIATHDLAEAERCSHVTVLAGGRVRAQGSPLEVARGSATRVHAVTGAAAIALADRIAALPGVAAAYPAALGLRVVTTGAAGAEVAALARAAGCTMTAREATLEDATLVLARQAPELGS